MSIETFETPQQADARAILKLFLEKLELLTDEERAEIIKDIRLLTSPLFISR